MFFYKNCRCPVCNGVFSEDDDIVACPQCGAPHHRACWQKDGQCHFADKHAEGFVWNREEAVVPPPPPPVEDDWDDDDDEDFDETVNRDEAPAEQDRSPRRCRRCGFPNPPYGDFCSRCGAPMGDRPPQGAGYGEYAPFHAEQPNPYGGVDPKEQISGETAEDMAAYVRINTPYYLPRFRDMEKTGRTISWNWGGFIFGSAWLLFRKRYVLGAILTVLEVLTQVLMLLSQTALEPFTDSLGNVEQLIAKLQATDPLLLLFMLLPTVAFALLHLVCGLFGTRIYMQSCARSVKRMRTQNAYGYKAFLPAAGGVSALIAMIGIGCVQFLSPFIYSLLL